MQVNQLWDGSIFGKKQAVCSKPHAFPLIFANYDHFKNIVIKKRFSPPLQVNHIRIFEKREQFMKQIYWHVFACPMVFHQGVGTMDAVSIAMGCYFNVYPVQSWAPDFVQLPFKPFKHV